MNPKSCTKAERNNKKQTIAQEDKQRQCKIERYPLREPQKPTHITPEQLVKRKSKAIKIDIDVHKTIIQSMSVGYTPPQTQ